MAGTPFPSWLNHSKATLMFTGLSLRWVVQAGWLVKPVLVGRVEAMAELPSEARAIMADRST
jgi:hypothetical protein